jgi:hypothetical protein
MLKVRGQLSFARCLKKPFRGVCFEHLEIWYSDLFRVSNFDIRIYSYRYALQQDEKILPPFRNFVSGYLPDISFN